MTWQWKIEYGMCVRPPCLKGTSVILAKSGLSAGDGGELTRMHAGRSTHGRTDLNDSHTTDSESSRLRRAVAGVTTR